MGCGKQDGGMLTALLRCYTEFYENKLSTYFRLTPLLWSFSSWMPMGCDYCLAMFRDGDKFAFSCWTESSSQHQSQIHEYRLSSGPPNSVSKPDRSLSTCPVGWTSPTCRGVKPDAQVQEMSTSRFQCIYRYIFIIAKHYKRLYIHCQVCVIVKISVLTIPPNTPKHCSPWEIECFARFLHSQIFIGKVRTICIRGFLFEAINLKQSLAPSCGDCCFCSRHFDPTFFCLFLLGFSVDFKQFLCFSFHNCWAQGSTRDSVCSTRRLTHHFHQPGQDCLWDVPTLLELFNDAGRLPHWDSYPIG